MPPGEVVDTPIPPIPTHENDVTMNTPRRRKRRKRRKRKKADHSPSTSPSRPSEPFRETGNTWKRARDIASGASATESAPRRVAAVVPDPSEPDHPTPEFKQCYDEYQALLRARLHDDPTQRTTTDDFFRKMEALWLRIRVQETPGCDPAIRAAVDEWKERVHPLIPILHYSLRSSSGLLSWIQQCTGRCQAFIRGELESWDYGAAQQDIHLLYTWLIRNYETHYGRTTNSETLSLAGAVAMTQLHLVYANAYAEDGMQRYEPVVAIRRWMDTHFPKVELSSEQKEKRAREKHRSLAAYKVIAKGAAPAEPESKEAGIKADGSRSFATEDAAVVKHAYNTVLDHLRDMCIGETSMYRKRAQDLPQDERSGSVGPPPGPQDWRDRLCKRVYKQFGAKHRMSDWVEEMHMLQWITALALHHFASHVPGDVRKDQHMNLHLSPIVRMVETTARYTTWLERQRRYLARATIRNVVAYDRATYKALHQFFATQLECEVDPQIHEAFSVFVYEHHTPGGTRERYLMENPRQTKETPFITILNDTLSRTQMKEDMQDHLNGITLQDIYFNPEHRFHALLVLFLFGIFFEHETQVRWLERFFVSQYQFQDKHHVLDQTRRYNRTRSPIVTYLCGELIIWDGTDRAYRCATTYDAALKWLDLIHGRYENKIDHGAYNISPYVRAGGTILTRNKSPFCRLWDARYPPSEE